MNENTYNVVIPTVMRTPTYCVGMYSHRKREQARGGAETEVRGGAETEVRGGAETEVRGGAETEV